MFCRSFKRTFEGAKARKNLLDASAFYRRRICPSRHLKPAQASKFHTLVPKRPQPGIPSSPVHWSKARSLRVTPEVSHNIPPRRKSRILHYLFKTAAYFGTFVAVSGGLIVAFFIYDASTYHETPIEVDIPVSELALNPRRGGPKNLPILEHYIDDNECESLKAQRDKPKLVILGTGWGSVAMLKKLQPENYNVTVISTSNHFLFTPMLPSGTVGTLELRSLVEPVRSIVHRISGHFVKASAEDIDFSEKLIEVSAKSNQAEDMRFYVPYDKVVVGVGRFYLICTKIAKRLTF